MKRLIAALALSATAVLAAACGGDGRPKTASPDDSLATAEHTVDPTTAPAATPPSGAPTGPAAPAAQGAPAFAVLYPGAELEQPAVTASGAAGDGGLVTFITEAEPDAVVAFYRARAEAAGLASTMAMNQGDARAYSAIGADAGANLQVVASPGDAGQTSVQLSWSAGR